MHYGPATHRGQLNRCGLLSVARAKLSRRKACESVRSDVHEASRESSRNTRARVALRRSFAKAFAAQHHHASAWTRKPMHCLRSGLAVRLRFIPPAVRASRHCARSVSSSLNTPLQHALFVQSTGIGMSVTVSSSASAARPRPPISRRPRGTISPQQAAWTFAHTPRARAYPCPSQYGNPFSDTCNN